MVDGRSVLLRIEKWDERFETAKTRTYKHKRQGAFPVEMGSRGYQRMLRQEHGPAMYGCFISLCMVAHEAPKPRQGYLADTTGIPYDPYSIEDLSLKTQMPEWLIEATIEFCASPKMCWITKHDPASVCDGNHTTGIPQGYHEDTMVPLNLKHEHEQKDTTLPRAGARRHVPEWVQERFAEFQEAHDACRSVGLDRFADTVVAAKGQGADVEEAMRVFVNDIAGAQGSVRPMQLLRARLEYNVRGRVGKKTAAARSDGGGNAFVTMLNEGGGR
jgi:hypothetical protein